MTEFRIQTPSATLDLGIVTSFQDQLKSSLTTTGIPTMSSDRTFVIDTGTTESFTLSFYRKDPDGDGMSNREWIETLQSLVDRWQMQTDGCTLYMIPDAGESAEIPSFSVNVYITSLSHTYNKGTPDLIEGQIRFIAGSVYGTYSDSPQIDAGDMTVMISDSTGSAWYYLMNTDFNCIESYKLYGGMNQPFEYIELTVPRRRMQSFASPLVLDDDIIAGKNQLIVNAVGRGSFIVTRCKLKDDTYTLTAYAYPEAFTGTVTKRRYTNTYSPYQIITDILREGVQIGNLSIIYTGSNFQSRYSIARDTWDGEVDFPTGSNAWYVMQVCALRLNCRIFFVEGVCYLWDCTQLFSSGWDAYQTRPLSLYTESATGATGPIYIYENVVDTAELGDEGTASLCTVCNVRYTSGDEIVTLTCYCNASSLNYYGEKGGKTLTLTEIHNEDDARIIGETYCEYLCESQTSIGFAVKELTEDGWNRAFEPTSAFAEIRDEVDETVVTNRSKASGEAFTQMLCQSTFQRSYPAGSSTYWYGIMQQTDLTQTVSSILSALNNVR